MGRRENTFRIDFSNVPKKPDMGKVHDFCATMLGLKQGEVLRIQNSRTLGVSFVKVTDLALAQRICEEHDNKHEISVDGKKYPLRITMEEGAVEVRIYDLSEDVSDQKVADALGRYGDVIAVREQRCGANFKFPGILTGVREAKMIVKQNIASWITIDGETTPVSYFGQRQTCRHCCEFIHIGVTCVQNKKLLVQKSYADAAKQMSPNGVPPQLPKQMVTNQINTTPIVAPVANKSTVHPAISGTMQPPKQPSRKQQKLLPPPVLTDENFPSLASKSAPKQPLDSGSMTVVTGQQPPSSGGLDRKTATEKSDGNETDSSVGSTSSRRHLRNRPPGKKPRVEEDNDNKQDESNNPS